MRLATIIGFNVESGKWEALYAGEAQKVLEFRDQLIRNSGKLRKGTKEYCYKEIRCLANHTAGGELKPKVRFD